MFQAHNGRFDYYFVFSSYFLNEIILLINYWESVVHRKIELYSLLLLNRINNL